MSELGAKLIEEIRNLAKENPERTAGCTYLDSDGAPVCIVGHAMFNLGLIDESAKQSDWNKSDFYILRFNGISGLDATDDAESRWIVAVQGMQDCGKEWGEAVEVADREVFL